MTGPLWQGNLAEGPAVRKIMAGLLGLILLLNAATYGAYLESDMLSRESSTYMHRSHANWMEQDAGITETTGGEKSMGYIELFGDEIQSERIQASEYIFLVSGRGSPPSTNYVTIDYSSRSVVLAEWTSFRSFDTFSSDIESNRCISKIFDSGSVAQFVRRPAETSFC